MDSTRQCVLTALRSVVDPEVGLDIVSMGLVYGLEVTPEELRVRLSLTTPGCPLGGAILGMARQALEGVAGAHRVRLEVVWDPPWDPRMLSRESQEALRR